MSGYDMNSDGLIEGFINEHVTGKGLDDRTKRAYRLDLEHFCLWLDQRQGGGAGDSGEAKVGANSSRNLVSSCEAGLSCSGGLSRHTDSSHCRDTENDGPEEWAEAYLEYLSTEKNLSSATVYRKSKVLNYYLSYLAKQGIISRRRALRPVRRLEQTSRDKNMLSKKESDAFFAAMNREYEELDSEFRKRICLRDMVMMELLFCHKIEISELLRLEVSDYDQKTGILMIRRKRGQDSYVYLFSQELRGKMARWLEERARISGVEEGCDSMFVSKLGKPLSMKMVIKIFDKYREMAGIEKGFTPKDLKENCMKQYARDLVMERYGG